jgi:hypothetical protein
MKRPGLVTVAAAVAGGVMTSAWLSATWVLTNGERVSGNIPAHAAMNANVSRARFAVEMSDGTERAIPMDQVAAIEFVGGAPPMTELDKLPAAGHMLALRDGSTLTGRLLDLVNGDLVRWQHASGRGEAIPIRTISRIYLDTESARRVYHYVSTAARAPAGPGVDVRADVAWNDTGLTVDRNEKIKFNPTGQVHWGPESGMISGPEGSPLIKNPGFPLPAMNVGALIGRVATSRAFYIGLGEAPITMPASGRLQLGINDNALTDNSGAFRVEILRGR